MPKGAHTSWMLAKFAIRQVSEWHIIYRMLCLSLECHFIDFALFQYHLIALTSASSQSILSWYASVTPILMASAKHLPLSDMGWKVVDWRRVNVLELIHFPLKENSQLSWMVKFQFKIEDVYISRIQTSRDIAQGQYFSYFWTEIRFYI